MLLSKARSLPDEQEEELFDVQLGRKTTLWNRLSEQSKRSELFETSKLDPRSSLASNIAKINCKRQIFCSDMSVIIIDHWYLLGP